MKKHKENKIYKVKLKKIKISDDFQKTPPRGEKLARKIDYYFKHDKKLESEIVLDSNYTLSDGYTSYIIAKLDGIKRVPVRFKN